MTNRPTFHVDLGMPGDTDNPDFSLHKEHDSLCYVLHNSCFARGGHHV